MKKVLIYCFWSSSVDLFAFSGYRDRTMRRTTSVVQDEYKIKARRLLHFSIGQPLVAQLYLFHLQGCWASCLCSQCNRFISASALFPLNPPWRRNIATNLVSTARAMKFVPHSNLITMKFEFILKLRSSIATRNTSIMFHLSTPCKVGNFLPVESSRIISTYFDTGRMKVNTRMMSEMRYSPLLQKSFTESKRV